MIFDMNVLNYINRTKKLNWTPILTKNEQKLNLSDQA